MLALDHQKMIRSLNWVVLTHHIYYLSAKFPSINREKVGTKPISLCPYNPRSAQLS